MSPRTLHSLLLAGLLVLLASGVYNWVYAGTYHDVQQLRLERGRVQTEYDELSGLAARHQVFVDSLAAAAQALLDSDRMVLAREDSKISFAYLNELATVAGRHMRLSLTTGQRHEYERYHSTSYMIEGEASFHQLFAFLWKLEHFKRLYTVESLHWHEITKSEAGIDVPRSLVRFRMAINGYATGSPWSADSTMTDTATVPQLGHNPFLPLVRDYIPPNSDNLLDVDHAQLQGLSEDRAFLVDHRQQLRTMQEGDRVYLGMLTDIDKTGGYAEFTLNKGGFIEKVLLRLPRRRQGGGS